ncbi:MAG TPA: sigma-70 family RNA polymerase sigma factor [Miltoncostaea sp.]|nr:sigma-70 family RNA polymerase sigma factor [Miltoncostaea sp.]
MIAAESGDPDARRDLVEAFLPSIAGLAAGFPDNLGVDRQELVQEGVTGLLFAARRYDATLGTPFWAYAAFWVRKAMQELFADLSRPVALSDRAVRGLARIRAARAEHLRNHAAEPTDGELSRATGITLRQLESLLAAERRPRGLEEPVSTDGTTSVGDTIADPAAEQAYDLVLDRIEVGEVRGLAEALEERARTVILAHYGLGQPAQTLGQIGAALGLTAERARQIEAAGLQSLRDALAFAVPPGAGLGSRGS